MQTNWINTTNSHGTCRVVRVRLKIIRNELIKNVGKFQSCMFSKLRIIFKRTIAVVVAVSVSCTDPPHGF